MNFGDNPVFSGIVGLISGNLLGSAVNRFVTVITERAMLSNILGVVSENKAGFIDNLFSMFLHVGILAFGMEMIATALPGLAENMGSYSLMMLGVMLTSDQLRRNLDAFNRFFYFPAVPDTTGLIIGPGGTRRAVDVASDAAAGGDAVPAY